MGKIFFDPFRASIKRTLYLDVEHLIPIKIEDKFKKHSASKDWAGGYQSIELVNWK